MAESAKFGTVYILLDCGWSSRLGKLFWSDLSLIAGWKGAFCLSEATLFWAREARLIRLVGSDTVVAGGHACQMALLIALPEMLLSLKAQPLIGSLHIVQLLVCTMIEPKRSSPLLVDIA